MRILFNCTTNVIGGAVQNDANFVKNTIHIENEKNSFIYLASPQVNEILTKWGIRSDFIFVLESPSKNFHVRKKISSIEKQFSPDIIYTMAGPAYVRFSGFHVMGISDPYITHGDLDSFIHGRTVLAALNHAAKTLIKGCIARFSANHFIFQTETSLNGFCKRFFLRKNIPLYYLMRLALI